MRLDPGLEVGFVDLELGGGPGDVPAVPAERPVDVPPLELVPGRFERAALGDPGQVLDLPGLDEQGEVGAR